MKSDNILDTKWKEIRQKIKAFKVEQLRRNVRKPTGRMD